MKSLSAILWFSVIAMFLGLLHLLCIQREIVSLEIKQLITAHLFNLIPSLICFVSILLVPWLKNKMGFSLLFGSVFKMLCLMVYLTYVILLLPEDENFILQFVAVYFSYLFLDVFYAVRLLKIASLNDV